MTLTIAHKAKDDPSRIAEIGKRFVENHWRREKKKKSKLKPKNKSYAQNN